MELHFEELERGEVRLVKLVQVQAVQDLAMACQEQAALAYQEQVALACQVQAALALEASLAVVANSCHLSSSYPAPCVHLSLGGK